MIKRQNVKQAISLLKRKYRNTDDSSFFNRQARSVWEHTKGKIRYPELFQIIHLFLIETDCPSEGALCEWIQKKKNSMGSLSYPSLNRIRDYAVLSVMLSMAEKVSITEQDLAKGIFFLRKIEEMDPEYWIAALSECEAMLLQNPVYRASSQTTKCQVRNRIAENAEKKKISETEAADRLVEKEQLYTDPPHPFSRYYFPVFLGVASLLCLLMVGFGLPAYAAAFLFLPFTELCKQLMDTVLSRTLSCRLLPRLELTEIPEEGKTLVIITALLTGDSDSSLSERLKEFACTNRDPQIRFAILADFHDAGIEKTSEEEQIISRWSEKIRLLNDTYGDRFHLFIRERIYSPKEKCYMGWERKRGAIIELIRFLKGKENHPNAKSFKTIIGSVERLQDIRYLLTLDSDTVLYPGAVRDLVSVMLHPANRPICRDKRVIQGFGVLQPRMEVSLPSSLRSHFTRLICEGGIDWYAGACFETYQTLFGEGFFCGKGMMDINAFEECIDGAFPENSVLSHDLLEGGRLRAATLSDLAFSDSVPGTPLSFFLRQHRWVRGDWQSLPFAFSHVRDENGKKRKNPASLLSRMQILDNLRRSLLPFSTILCLFLALFQKPADVVLLSISGLLYVFFPFLVSLPAALRFAFRISREQKGTVLTRALARLGYDLFSLAQSAYINIDATVRALYRSLISHQKCLEWVTAEQGDRKQASLGIYLIRMFPSLGIGLLFLIVSKNMFLLILGTGWFLYPFLSFLLSFQTERNKEKVVRDKDKVFLRRCAFDMWRFFERFVRKEDHYLPPDNYQMTPAEATAHRTSPTNIGLYLLSCLAACDFDFIKPEELYGKLNATLSVVETLPKWNGHLFNWYDTETLSVLGHAYVSTVDSGNFITSLIALASGIKEYAEKEPLLGTLTDRINRLISGADFIHFYNKRKKLLSIGYDTVRNQLSENCYDLYMSEARTTSFYAVASGMLPIEHWKTLRRPVIASRNSIGLASWTGTMFEYTMPSLFLPVPQGSLSEEALFFAVRMQRMKTIRGIWGKSESGYYAFDEGMNYQYQAFGVQKLALKRGMDLKNVFSPYSTMLALSVSPSSAMNNLKKMKKKGLYGEYGFYEAIDLTHSRAQIVRSYMAHHTGMSMLAAANACFDQIFVKRTMRNPSMAGGQVMLEEKIPIFSKPERIYGEKEKTQHRYWMHYENRIFTLKEQESSCMTALFSRGHARILVSQDGGILLSVGDEDLTLTPFCSPHSFRGLRLYAMIAGETVDCMENVSLTQTMAGIHAEKKIGKDRLSVSFGIHPHFRCFQITMTWEGCEQPMVPLLMFQPVLKRPADYAAHPVFSDLSILSRYDEEDQILSFIRLPREPEEKEKVLSVSMGNDGFSFAVERDKILPLLYDEQDLKKLMEKPLPCHDGPIPQPFCVVRGKAVSGKKRCSCRFFLAYGTSENETKSILSGLRNIENIQSDQENSGFLKIQPSEFSSEPFSVFPSPEQRSVVTVLTTAMTHPYPDEIQSISQAAEPKKLWQYDVSGDKSMFFLSVSPSSEVNESMLRTIQEYAAAHKTMILSGLSCDLVILFEKNGDYMNETEKKLNERIKRAGHPRHSPFGSLFLIGLNTEERMQAEALFSLYACFEMKLDLDTVPETVTLPVMNRIRKETLRPDQNVLCEFQKGIRKVSPVHTAEANCSDSLPVVGGSFEKNGFLIHKNETKIPWSFVYVNPSFGTLMTQFSLGYTWRKNCHENRITPFEADPLLDFSGERLLLKTEETVFDLCSCAEKVVFSFGYAIYQGCCGGVRYLVTAGVDPLLPVKLIHVQTDSGSVSYEIKPLLGSMPRYPSRYNIWKEKNGVVFRSAFSSEESDTGFLFQIGNPGEPGGRGAETAFLLGASVGKREKTREYIEERFKSPASVLKALKLAEERISERLFRIELRSSDPYLDTMVNFYLPYQVSQIRMTARGGFYQSGGAYGFRDQLQDSISALYFDPSMTKRQITRCACRQYEEGDVMHWWHETAHGPRGVRTRCSDDRLWLPYVTGLYLNRTGDRDILSLSLPYLVSSPLMTEETDRYESPDFSNSRESLLRHCLKALDLSLGRMGQHGLPLMEGGDWNDGMNRVGKEGKGESVWLGFFLILVLDTFLPHLSGILSDAQITLYETEKKRLKEACEKQYQSGRYCRAFFDDGTPIGDGNGNACRIDLLPQAFSVFSKAEKSRAQSAMDHAIRELYNERTKTLSLFSPPYRIQNSDFQHDPGYIRSYIPGVRENGGQYTHAAVWGAMAELELGDTKRAVSILLNLNPARITSDPESGIRYRGEPYFLAGDVYTLPGREGQAGWTLYTGAASWYYYAVLSHLLGLKLGPKSFSIFPKLSESFDSFILTFSLAETRYQIQVVSGNENQVLLDGQKCENEFPFDKKDHIVKIMVEKKDR